MKGNILSRAVKRAEKHLPQSPRKRVKVVHKLMLKFSPSTFIPPKRKRQDQALSADVIQEVRSFYETDDISSQAPGKNDFIIIRDAQQKTKVQKRYLLLTIGEAYQEFKLANPNMKIGKSKFAEMRPSHVSLRADTPANICLCSYHENIRLILTSITALPNTTSDFIKKIVCDYDNEACMLQSCEECGKLSKYDHRIQEIMDESSEVTFKQWAKTEDKLARTSMKDSLKNCLELLRSKLTAFLKHVHVKHVQSAHFKKLKEELPSKKALIHIDFSENFTHTIQDEIQSAYWDTPSSTLYTAMAYYRKDQTTPADDADPQHSPLLSIPYVIVSDYKHHDKYAVAVFNDLIQTHLETKYGPIDSIEFQSDGAAQHFKQRFSLCYMSLNSKPTKWHFSATSHGKGCIDGIGGTIKRRVAEAVRASQQDMTTSQNFADVAAKVCPNINILYAAKENVEKAKSRLDSLWTPHDCNVHTLPGIRQYHYFESLGPYVLRCATTAKNVTTSKTFSFIDGKVQDHDACDHSVHLEENCESDDAGQVETTTPAVTSYTVGQWVNVTYESQSYCGLILDEQNGHYRIRCLLETQQGKSYRFEAERDAIWYDSSAIMSLMSNVPNLLNARGLYSV